MATIGSGYDDAVPPVIHKGAAWSWRLLAILAFGVAMIWVITRLEVIVVPIALALMLTSLMIPAVCSAESRSSVAL